MAATFPLESVPPTSLKLQHSSPLDTLVRRTSKRARATAQSQPQQQQQPTYLVGDYTPSRSRHDEEERDPYGGYVQDPTLSPPRRPFQQHAPGSPLLHSHFARNSATSSSINDSYLDVRSSVDSRSIYQDLEYRYHDDESIYSQQDLTSPALRDSWRSAATSGTVRPYDPDNTLLSKTPTATPEFQPIAPESSNAVQWTPAVPTLVISSPDADSYGNRTGRAPVVRPITSNFSRPVRPSSPSGPSQQTVTFPPLPPSSEEQKRRVLERNASRTTSQSPSQQNPSQSTDYHSRSTSPSLMYRAQDQQVQLQTTSSASLGDSLPNPHAQGSANMPPQVNNYNATGSYQGIPGGGSSGIRKPSPQPDQHLRRQPPQGFLQPSSTSQLAAGNRTSGSYLAPTQSVALPRQPPPRSSSPASLYSSYSYYDYESPVPSPLGGRFSPQSSNDATQPPSPGPLEANHSPRSNQRSRSPSNRPTTPTTMASQTPQDYLQLGIQHHESNRLRESAMYFEKSAKENGGCGVGMLMWGLALRHGWGCEKNEKVGFKWLRKAAENAVVDLESARDGKGIDAGSVQEELVLAIYEVGQCFFHGWGVPKDQKMAVSYYTVAARLGDPDAQNDLAFCLANGRGCKKDRKEAAKWYRAAVAQGASDVGLAWIYKDKFM